VKELRRDEELSGERPDGEATPDELGALRTVIEEFVDRLQNIENEIGLLREDRTDLIEEYKEKLDMPTLKAALQVIKIQKNVKHRDTFDSMIAALESKLV
jgi:uncharacterized protein (UPF0335 family)